MTLRLLVCTAGGAFIAVVCRNLLSDEPDALAELSLELSSGVDPDDKL